MMLAWMVHGALVGALLAIAALALDRAARAFRRPARFLWLAALAAAVTVPGVRLLSARGVASDTVAATTASAGYIAAPVKPSGERTGTSRPSILSAVPIPSRLSAFDLPLLVAWFAGSLLWGAILLGSARRLWRRSTAWCPGVVEGQPVFVSHDVGPALFGLVRYSVVVPSWVVELDPRQQRLVLAHEREHARAADPAVLAAGALLVLLQPWNPAVWLMFRRLRFAVEADCDARVLARSSEVRAYGELLLELGERTLAGAAPVAALSQPHSHLERRVRLMTQHPHSRRLTYAAAWLSLAGLLAIGACRMPRPVAASQPRPGRALVHITSVGLEDVQAPFTILVFPVGQARVGFGVAAPTELEDTVRLHALPAMTVDVTDGDVHLRLAGAGMIRVEGDVTGGPAIHLSGRGPEIVLLKGGTGVRIAGGAQG